MFDHYSIASRIPPGLGPWIEGPWRRSLQRGNVTNMVAASLRMGSKFWSKLVPTWLPNGPWRSLLDVLEASWSPEKSLVGPRRASRGVWGALGRLLERSWKLLEPKKLSLDRLLDGFELIGGQIHSQNEPRRVPNRGPKAIRAENGELFKKT